MSAPNIILCISVRNSHPDYVTRGSTISSCDRCIQEIWVAPSTKEIMASWPNAKIELACEECLLPNLRKHPFQFMMPNTQQQEEIRENLEKNLKK